MEREPLISRRGLLRTAAGTTAVAAGTAATAGEAAAATPDLSSWFSDTSNYHGVVDRTGQDTVTVKVGVSANGGAYGFGPPAVRVSPGTTVTWVWTGRAAPHSVDAQTGASFNSGLHSKEGYTFSHTFDQPGVVEYFCKPHASLGMKGAVVVGDAAGGGSGGGGGQAASGGGQAAGGSTGSGGASGGTLASTLGLVGTVGIAGMAVLVSAVVGITVYSYRSDRHSPGAPERE